MGYTKGLNRQHSNGLYCSRVVLSCIKISGNLLGSRAAQILPPNQQYQIQATIPLGM